MDKWQYLDCTLGLFAIINTSIAIEHFSSAFPSAKVTSSRKGIISIEWKGKSNEVAQFNLSVLEYLGSQGWEAFHA